MVGGGGEGGCDCRGRNDVTCMRGDCGEVGKEGGMIVVRGDEEVSEEGGMIVVRGDEEVSEEGGIMWSCVKSEGRLIVVQ